MLDTAETRFVPEIRDPELRQEAVEVISKIRELVLEVLGPTYTLARIAHQVLMATFYYSAQVEISLERRQGILGAEIGAVRERLRDMGSMKILPED